MITRNAIAGLLFAGAGLLAGPAPAQEAEAPSFEATLRQECPAKNLDFLPSDELAERIGGFIEGLPQQRREDVVEAGRSDVAACSGDGACTTRAALGALRRLGLAAGFARSLCALPVRCAEVSRCGPDPDAAAPLRSADAEIPEPPPPAEGLLRAPPRPATPRDAALGFYRALARGDGIGAEWYVVPEKRGSGAFVASGIERFYGDMPEPLRIVSAEETGPSTVSVRYRFTARGGAVCDGRSTVTVRETPEGFRIARILAPSGC
jgi:hypothetical protein